ncbi:MAG: hypothetical protein ACE5EW_05635, partial [Thermoplasmata archaeon]
TQEDALLYLEKKFATGQAKEYRLRKVDSILNRSLLPHLGDRNEDRIKKALFLGRIARTILELSLDLRRPDDKDHYANKRLKLAGDLMEDLFRVAFANLIKDLKYQLERSYARGKGLKISAAIRPDLLSQRLLHALSTGNWVGGRAGVSQLLDRTSHMSAMSHLRRVTSPLTRSQPHFEARDLHPTQWGRLCPNETPEGQNCVTPETDVLLENGTISTIADLEENWAQTKLTSVDWKRGKRFRKAHLARYIRTEPNPHLFRLSTQESGRSILATKDHPFFTPGGKTDLADLKPGDDVAVLPGEPLRFEAPQPETLVDEARVERALTPRSNLDYTLKTLHSHSLLPLRADNPKLPTLARLAGHLFGDGTLYMPESKKTAMMVFTGPRIDLESIRGDLRSLGFSVSKVTSHRVRSEVADGVTTRCVCYSKPLAALMASLGVPRGDKAASRYGLPPWLRRVPRWIRREFLAAYFGSELTKPAVDARNGKTFLGPSFSLNKLPSALASGRRFARQIESLLREFDVQVARTEVVRGWKRKSGEVTQKVRVHLSSQMESLRNFYARVGYQYCRDRELYARYAVAYIDLKRSMLTERTAAKSDVLGHFEEGRSVPEIRRLMGPRGIRKHDVENWVKNPAGGVRVSELDFPRFSEFIADRTAGLNESGLVWESVASITPVDGTDVRDVTTWEDYHSFIGNGFLVGNCGLVKNAALVIDVSEGFDEDTVKLLLADLGTRQVAGQQTQLVRVYVNGDLVGLHEDPETLVEEIRGRRRSGLLSHEVNIRFDRSMNEIIINCDEGRMRRPLTVLRDGRPVLSKKDLDDLRIGKLRWTDLVDNGIVEWIDAEEEEDAFIALYGFAVPRDCPHCGKALSRSDVDWVNPGSETGLVELQCHFCQSTLEGESLLTKEHTHMEIDPLVILGVSAGLVPYAEHNSSPRVTMGAGMIKQSLGLAASNYRLRPDTRGHLLHYPQAPLVQTEAMHFLNFNRRPAGQNFVVAVMSYHGWNMEDAVVINKASVERGLGRSSFMRTYKAEERRYPGGQEDHFETPSP